MMMPRLSKMCSHPPTRKVSNGLGKTRTIIEKVPKNYTIGKNVLQYTNMQYAVLANCGIYCGTKILRQTRPFSQSGLKE